MVHRYYRLPSLTSLAAFERPRGIEVSHALPTSSTSRPEPSAGRLRAGGGARRAAFRAEPNGPDAHGGRRDALCRARPCLQPHRRDYPGHPQRQPPQRVTLACTHAIALAWLMPRMGISAPFPEITVDHLISDDARDFRRAEVDLRIRYGFGAWPDETAAPLMEETIYPIAGPDSPAGTRICRHGHSRPSVAARRMGRCRMDRWDELLRRAGIPHGPLSGRRFSTFGVVLAGLPGRSGTGHRLASPGSRPDRRGRVVPFTDLSIPSPGCYYLTWNTNRSSTKPPEQFAIGCWRLAGAETQLSTV